MYYYKNFDAEGNLIGLETRQEQLATLSSNMLEITQSEYQSIMEEILANVEENIAYEPNLREELAEVKEQLAATQDAVDVLLLGGME